MNREMKLAGATLVLSTMSNAYAQPASSASSASAPYAATPPGGDLWSVAIVGGFVGGAVAGVIVAVAVVSQLKKSLNTTNTTNR